VLLQDLVIDFVALHDCIETRVDRVAQVAIVVEAKRSSDDSGNPMIVSVVSPSIDAFELVILSRSICWVALPRS